MSAASARRPDRHVGHAAERDPGHVITPPSTRNAAIAMTMAKSPARRLNSQNPTRSLVPSSGSRTPVITSDGRPSW